MTLLGGPQFSSSGLLVARIALFIVGAGLFAIGLLLDEAEERVLLERLAAWWVRLDDFVSVRGSTRLTKVLPAYA
jgi:hypothetical protein